MTHNPTRPAGTGRGNRACLPACLNSNPPEEIYRVSFCCGFIHLQEDNVFFFISLIQNYACPLAPVRGFIHKFRPGPAAFLIWFLISAVEVGAITALRWLDVPRVVDGICASIVVTGSVITTGIGSRARRLDWRFRAMTGPLLVPQPTC